MATSKQWCFASRMPTYAWPDDFKAAEGALTRTATQTKIRARVARTPTQAHALASTRARLYASRRASRKEVSIATGTRVQHGRHNLMTRAFEFWVKGSKRACARASIVTSALAAGRLPALPAPEQKTPVLHRPGVCYASRARARAPPPTRTPTRLHLHLHLPTYLPT